MPTVEILTVGHSNHPLDRFVELLRLHHVTAIADVRSQPYSKHAPQFSREALRPALFTASIEYVFLGKQLGARTPDPRCYDESGRVVFDRLSRTQSFIEGLQRTIQGATSHRVALMCTERDPLDCHRTILVATALIERGIRIRHILPDGRLESHDDALLRLVDRQLAGQRDLFASPEDLIRLAVHHQSSRIAFVDEKRAVHQPAKP